MKRESADMAAAPSVSLFYNPRIRGFVFQLALCLIIGFLLYEAVTNASENLRRQKIASGLGFWDNPAGFPISQTLIPYSESFSSYGQAFWVGLLNTLLVAAIGIVLATLLGFAAGVARLSKNILLAGVARWYVEIIRNIPLLLQLLFWYNAVLKALPNVRDSLALPLDSFLNNRGLFMPAPRLEPGFGAVAVTFSLGLIGTIAYARFARARQEMTGRQAPVGWATLGLLLGLPL